LNRTTTAVGVLTLIAVASVDFFFAQPSLEKELAALMSTTVSSILLPSSSKCSTSIWGWL